MVDEDDEEEIVEIDFSVIFTVDVAEAFFFVMTGSTVEGDVTETGATLPGTLLKLISLAKSMRKFV